MSLPIVSLISGTVSWDPGTPVTGADVTGYVVGLRSLNSAGSIAGSYPIVSPPVISTSDALAAIASSLKPDDYAVSVQALSANGPSDWATEYQFTGVLPIPNPPTSVSVA